jgi:hypothetical protein
MPTHIGESLIHITESALDLWAGTLGATGGALEDSKTYIVPIIHCYKKHLPALANIRDEYNLHLKRPDGSKIALLRKTPTDSLFTLGIWQSPSSDETRQIQHMISQIKTWGKNTTNNKISWVHARIAIQATIGRTLAYPLVVATAFNTKQCKILQTCFLRESLGKRALFVQLH